MIAIVAAGLWALYTFVYQETIKPALEEPTAQILTSIEHGGTDRTRDFAILVADVRNTGRVPIDVVAESYDLYGLQIADHRSVQTNNAPNRVAEAHTFAYTSNVLLSAYAQLRDGAIGGLADSHATLRPDEHLAFRWMVPFPRNVYQALTASITFIYARAPVEKKIAVAIRRGSDGTVRLDSSILQVNQAAQLPL